MNLGMPDYIKVRQAVKELADGCDEECVKRMICGLGYDKGQTEMLLYALRVNGRISFDETVHAI